MTQQDKQLSVFPAFFKVENEVAAVFGNGDEAYAKARLLKNTEARIVAYADAPRADYAAFLAANAIEQISEAFDPSQVQGARLVFAATGEGALDRMHFDACEIGQDVGRVGELRPVVLDILAGGKWP